uniref:Uncharacterized protein n=1 Tax=Rhizophora mucronata TaxID=61149 RepID=A0A2P2R3R9_RHIMU
MCFVTPDSKSNHKDNPMTMKLIKLSKTCSQKNTRE